MSCSLTRPRRNRLKPSRGNSRCNDYEAARRRKIRNVAALKEDINQSGHVGARKSRILKAHGRSALASSAITTITAAGQKFRLTDFRKKQAGREQFQIGEETAVSYVPAGILIQHPISILVLRDFVQFASHFGSSFRPCPCALICMQRCMSMIIHT